MADSKLATTPPRTGSTSPPPNCAICLGTCVNKCFSDSCMHEFCFKCLLEWSKIKAECPLCKQAFKTIIHNIKSLDEYEEHIVENIRVEENRFPDPFQYQFRTTFTVDTHGEHALRQMLLRHPHLHILPERRRRVDPTSTTFRRSIYNRDLWVYAPPDITGRYRDCSPAFFRNAPGARTRLVPWLIRELNALLYENTQQVMPLVDIIMNHLFHHHIYSYMFRSLLRNFLGNKTDHFIHEFYNFMRSPFDMFGYDRYVIYTERPIPSIDISDYDRDVILVSDTDDNSPEQSSVPSAAASSSQPPIVDDVVINLDTDSDEPIIVSESRFPANPIHSASTSATHQEETVSRQPIMPIKMRVKSLHREGRLRAKPKYFIVTSSSSSSSSSSESPSSDSDVTYGSESAAVSTSRGKKERTSSSSDSDYEHRWQTQRKMLRRLAKNKKRKELKSHSKANKRANNSSDEDDIPLLSLAKKRKKEKGKTRRKSSHTVTSASTSKKDCKRAKFNPSSNCNSNNSGGEGASTSSDLLRKCESRIKIENNASTTTNSNNVESETGEGLPNGRLEASVVKSELKETVVKRENFDLVNYNTSENHVSNQNENSSVPTVRSKIVDIHQKFNNNNNTNSSNNDYDRLNNAGPSSSLRSAQDKRNAAVSVSCDYLLNPNYWYQRTTDDDSSEN